MKQSKPMVTVVTVTFNAEEYLEKTILSVIEQDYKNIEYIIVDGGSTDKTIEIIKKYEEKISFWISEPDEGIYDAMNKGVKYANGEFVNFMNAGDVFFDNTVCSRIFSNEITADLIYGDTIFYDNYGNEDLVKAKSLDKLWEAMIFNHNSLFAKKDLLVEYPFDLNYKIVADSKFVIECYLSKKKFCYKELIVNKNLLGGFSDTYPVLRIIERWQLVSIFKLYNQENINIHYFRQLYLGGYYNNYQLERNRKKVLFIGNQFHKKTLSSLFFIHLLEKYFHIDILWLNPSNITNRDFEKIKEYKNIVFWQFMEAHDKLYEILSKRNTILIPMYDGMGAYQNNGNINLFFWEKYKNFKFINFSKYVNNHFKNTIQIQYAESKYNITLQENKKKYKLFFWQRRNEITWNELRQLIDPAQIESIHIHKSVDPNMTFVEPTEEDIRNYNITFSEWFETKEEYLKKVKDCDIYVSPRLYEGIGMSFLEAMSLGKCIIAPNFPTMNEYIVNNENGLLYDIKNLKKLDLSKANDLGFNAYKTIEEISKIWKQSEQKIIDFIIQEKQILEPQKKNIIKQKEDKNFNIYKSIEKVCSLSFFKSPIKKYKAYKSMLKTFHIEKNKFKQKQNEKGKIRKVLIVFPHNPFLLQNGVQTRFYELIKYFNKISYSVDILSHTNFVDKWDEKHINHKFINKVYFNDFKQSKSQGNLNNSVLPNFAFNSLQEQIEKLHTTQNYDLLLMSYVHWANVAKNLNNIKKYIMIEDFISMNNYERSNGKYNLGQSINEEIERINLFDKAICISKEEANFFERACKDVEFHHIPHFLESKFSEVKKDTDIVFVGSDNPFNRDGMIWFFEYVMPYLSDVYKIKIIGRVNEHLEKYKNRFKNIEFISYVENLDDIYSKSKISICPLQGGTGLKIKVVESLSYGVPIVSTKYGIVGMDSKHNGCIVVDEPQEFANEIKNILEDEQKYKNLQNEAKEYFVENFSKESVYKKLDKVFFE